MQNKYFHKIVALLAVLVFQSGQGICQFSNNKNYVATIVLKKPGVKTIPNVNSLPGNNKTMSVDYIDGLGRVEQKVQVNGAEVGRDIIQPIAFDALGRQDRNYLIYSSDATTSGYGAYRSGWASEQSSFYQSVNTLTLPNDLADNFPYDLKQFDNSPLNMVKASYGAGSSWAGTAGPNAAGVNVKTEMLIYTAASNDEVKTWDINWATTRPIPVIATANLYQAGDLVKTKVTDEHGKVTLEYKDKSGNIILRKIQQANTTGPGAHDGWLCTYYVYNSLNQLNFVIPPRAVEYLQANSWVLSQNIIDELCFWYIYDIKGNVRMKHSPGAGQESIVSDMRDRVVFKQDAKMAADGKWTVILYDQLNRPVATALWSSTLSWEDLFATMISQVAVANQAETILGDNFIISQKPSFINISSLDIQTLSFYDGYNNTVGNTNVFNTNFNTPFAPGVITPGGDYPMAVDRNRLVKGQVTATKAKILDGSSNYLFSVSYFDKDYRVLQTQKQNYATNYPDIVTTQYDFSGKQLGTFQSHQAYLGTPTTLILKNEYNTSGLLEKTYSGINASIATKVIAKNEYDRLGRLRTKTTGEGTICEFKQDYTYNIRGWVRGVNMNYLEGNIRPDNQRYFGYELGYNTLVTGGSMSNPQMNGNIATAVWASAGKTGRNDYGSWMPSSFGIKRKYDYKYDNSNRLVKADFREYISNQWSNTQKDFSLSGAGTNGEMTYDANGNILTKKQKGVLDGFVSDIDDLAYTYMNNGFSNKLDGVREWIMGNDQYSHVMGDFYDGPSNGWGGGAGFGTDYHYDVNGNLIRDLNKSIMGGGDHNDGIIYNYMNLPSQVNFEHNLGDSYVPKGHIKYTYDALGNKLRKYVHDQMGPGGLKTITTDYINGFLYRNGELQSIGTNEGRIRWAFQQSTQAYEFRYDWFVKDHLGNIRMILTEEQDPTARQYVASFEDAPTGKVSSDAIKMEQDLFGEEVLSAVRTDVPVELKEKDKENRKAALLKPGQSKGKTPYKIVKLGSGDKVSIGVNYYYRPAAKSQKDKEARNRIFRDLVTGIIGSASGAVGSEGKDPSAVLSQPVSAGNPTPGYQQFLDDNDQDSKLPGSKPKAYLNYVMMDTGMNFIKGGAFQVGEMDVKDPEWKILSGKDIKMEQSGYFMVYISNEEKAGGSNVYFDDLILITNEGPIMEENHYYPFGLLIHELSSAGTGRLSNKMKYNGKELQREEFRDGSGLEMYDYGARLYDPQLGRWQVVDPLAGEMRRHSPYNYAYNNPIRYIDPDGMSPTTVPVSGSPEDKKILVAHMNEITGGKYKIKNGNLVAVRGNYGTGVNADLAKQSITSSNSFPMALVNNDSKVFIDSYLNTSVDVGDISLGDKVVKGSLYAHFMKERLSAGDRYQSRELRAEDLKPMTILGFDVMPFLKYHNDGLQAETDAIKYHTGKNDITLRQQKAIPWGGDYPHLKSGTKYDYGGISIDYLETSPTFINFQQAFFNPINLQSIRVNY